MVKFQSGRVKAELGEGLRVTVWSRTGAGSEIWRGETKKEAREKKRGRGGKKRENHRTIPKLEKITTNPIRESITAVWIVKMRRVSG